MFDSNLNSDYISVSVDEGASDQEFVAMVKRARQVQAKLKPGQRIRIAGPLSAFSTAYESLVDELSK